MCSHLYGKALKSYSEFPGIHLSGAVVALRDEPRIRTITTRHEAGATHMAEVTLARQGNRG